VTPVCPTPRTLEAHRILAKAIRLARSWVEAWFSVGTGSQYDMSVNWFNQAHAAFRTDLKELNELNYARFESK
jgi:hypothetical protein